MSGGRPTGERAAAIKAGAIKYFTGRPCCRGHVCARYTRNSECLMCKAIFDEQHPRDRTEAKRRSLRRYRKTEKGKAAIKRYRMSEKGKAAQARYLSSEKGLEAKWRRKLRHAGVPFPESVNAE